jgi:hypothetical protein
MMLATRAISVFVVSFTVALNCSFCLAEEQSNPPPGRGYGALSPEQREKLSEGRIMEHVTGNIKDVPPRSKHIDGSDGVLYLGGTAIPDSGEPCRGLYISACSENIKSIPKEALTTPLDNMRGHEVFEKQKADLRASIEEAKKSENWKEFLLRQREVVGHYYEKRRLEDRAKTFEKSVRTVMEDLTAYVEQVATSDSSIPKGDFEKFKTEFNKIRIPMGLKFYLDNPSWLLSPRVVFDPNGPGLLAGGEYLSSFRSPEADYFVAAHELSHFLSFLCKTSLAKTKLGAALLKTKEEMLGDLSRREEDYADKIGTKLLGNRLDQVKKTPYEKISLLLNSVRIFCGTGGGGDDPHSSPVTRINAFLIDPKLGNIACAFGTLGRSPGKE